MEQQLMPRFMALPLQAHRAQRVTERFILARWHKEAIMPLTLETKHADEIIPLRVEWKAGLPEGSILLSGVATAYDANGEDLSETLLVNSDLAIVDETITVVDVQAGESGQTYQVVHLVVLNSGPPYVLRAVVSLRVD